MVKKDGGTLLTCDGDKGKYLKWDKIKKETIDIQLGIDGKL